ncbi:hypothetical protein [Listeria newyorkensis]|uniref:hypothetical protein n=1 Tax=Listeria newyorkensis TaxID=1497681 RepID=UPI00051DA7E0|nr:hypothetical protein [Listeria newyorkensis]KGL44101.1 hypothetical protein EP58_06535 [Listeria newyorkensis]SQC57475.1 Uncharacterised protein [Listeria newyorkensis]
MSHFTVAVITKTGTPEEVDNLLGPFDEEIEVPHYTTKADIIKKGRASIESYKNGTYQEYLNNPEKYLSECNNERHINYISIEFPKKLEWTDEEVYAEEIKWAEEENIKDDGSVFSNYNPKSKWDWYQIGGRWKNMLILKNGGVADTAKIENIDLSKTNKTFALLTPEGEWYERGKMGWWATVTDKNNNYSEEYTKLLLENQDCFITIVDCHI